MIGEIINSDYYFNICSSIDRLLLGSEYAVVAIDGCCASGKSTLATLLSAKYGCPVFHMDDFFLPPEKRTKTRLEAPGGNIDSERFLEEVLEPLSRSGSAVYRRFCCTDNIFYPPLTQKREKLMIVEGSYSMHPDLREYYDLKIFLSVNGDEQYDRILQREGIEGLQVFREKWIPMENRYFETHNVRQICDIIVHDSEDITSRSPASF